MWRDVFQRARVVSMAWGILLSVLVCRHFFALGPGEFFSNHDVDGYGLRLIEFRDCLKSGYLFPQWCVHFRSALGSPFFTFYQSGFFYLASLTPASWSIPQQIGTVVLAMSIVGYWGMYGLIGSRFGSVAGALSGTSLLSALYVYTELYIRGDYSEYAAMMFVPMFLHGLLRFAETSFKWWGCLAALCGAMVVITHPVVALFSYGMVTVLVTGISVRDRDRQFVLRALIIAMFGAGLSAFYWVPLFIEMPLVSGANAWSGNVLDGYYHYSRHFIPLSWFFNFADTPTPIPVKLGPLHLLGAIAGAVSAARGWKSWSREQRHVCFFCGAMFTGSLALITPTSVYLWDHLPLLQRAQFPWRFLTLVTIALAGLVGLGACSIRNRWGSVIFTGALCVVLTWKMVLGTNAPKIISVDVPPNAAGIADRYFSPDMAGEWVPRGAQVLSFSEEGRIPVANHPVTIKKYVVEQGRLLCDLTSPEESLLVLPHYYYPKGFTATLNGVPVILEQSPRGLMRVRLPASFSGEVRVVWHTTPAKWWGVSLSALVAVAGIVTLRFAKRRNPLNQTESIADLSAGRKKTELALESR